MKKRRPRDKEVTYWEPMADGVIGLLLCVLLILMLLILYLMRAKDYDYIGDSDDHGKENGGYGYTYEDTERADDYDGDGDGEYEYEHNGGGGGGGFPYEDPDPGKGEGDGSEKAAVLVQVVDGETQRTLKQPGIEFELYNSAMALQVLSTYYPVKIDYKKYETDKEGMFYLPEKIPLGTYYLNNLTQIDGYDLAGNWEFSPDRDYDWDEPYLVSVEVFPSKNVIRIQLKDNETGEKLTGAAFDIVAAENIVTKDGTTRYKMGEIADSVEVDAEGFAESKELYLGKYSIRQKTTPEYYSALLTDTPVTIKSKKTEPNPAVNELREQKTSVTISVVDALYDTQPVPGAVFEVVTGNGERVGSFESDGSGTVKLTNLKKATTYRVKQTTTAKNYKIDPQVYAFTVNDKGLVNQKETEQLTVKNSIIRASFSVRDRLLKKQISDINITLVDGSGKTVQSWNSSAVDNVIEGLVPGEYSLLLNGDQDNATNIIVADTIDLQAFSVEKWTMIDTGIVGIAAMITAAILAALAFLIKRNRNNKQMEERPADGE